MDEKHLLKRKINFDNFIPTDCSSYCNDHNRNRSNVNHGCCNYHSSNANVDSNTNANPNSSFNTNVNRFARTSVSDTGSDKSNEKFSTLLIEV